MAQHRHSGSVSGSTGNGTSDDVEIVTGTNPAVNPSQTDDGSSDVNADPATGCGTPTPASPGTDYARPKPQPYAAPRYSTVRRTRRSHKPDGQPSMDGYASGSVEAHLAASTRPARIERTKHQPSTDAGTLVAGMCNVAALAGWMPCGADVLPADLLDTHEATAGGNDPGNVWQWWYSGDAPASVLGTSPAGTNGAQWVLYTARDAGQPWYGDAYMDTLASHLNGALAKALAAAPLPVDDTCTIDDDDLSIDLW